jgi:YidC/Oxa1 family membrane protein insertase
LNVPGQKDKFTPELRILVASLLSMVVILAWAKYFGPKPPIHPPQPNRPAQTAPAASGATSASSSATPASQAPTVAAAPTPVPANVPRRSDSQERTITIENNLYRVEFSNQGGVVKSWKLKKYTDDTKPPQKCRDGSNPPCVLDLVHQQASQQTGGWPFGVILDDEQLQNAANGGLYQVSSSANTLSAPADLEFTWSDGHLEVTKHFHFDHSYVVRAETSAKLNGSPIKAGSADSAI